ncbi:winged helix-turn-helix domain-containing protein [Vibrio cholerae]
MNTKRILIIEDDRDAANVLEAYLRRENFGVILAHDGKAGLEAALTQHPALILLGHCLPESDALERVVDTHIYNLRRKLEKAGVSGVLSSVRGGGYRYLQP